MQYPPHAVELIREALERADQALKSVFTDSHGIAFGQVSRKFVAWISQFGYRWCQVDPLEYVIRPVEEKNGEYSLWFDPLRRNDGNTSLCISVPASVGTVAEMCATKENQHELHSETLIRYCLTVREIAVRGLSPLYEQLVSRTWASGRPNGESNDLRGFRGLPDCSRVWLDGEELTPSEPQSRFLSVLVKHYPDAATWDTIKRGAPGFTHSRAFDVFKGNYAGPLLWKIIDHSRRRYRLTKPLITIS